MVYSMCSHWPWSHWVSIVVDFVDTRFLLISLRKLKISRNLILVHIGSRRIFLINYYWKYCDTVLLTQEGLTGPLCPLKFCPSTQGVNDWTHPFSMMYGATYRRYEWLDAYILHDVWSCLQKVWMTGCIHSPWCMEPTTQGMNDYRHIHSPWSKEPPTQGMNDWRHPFFMMYGAAYARYQWLDASILHDV